MNTTLDELHSAVLSLPEAERARLAARILASLDEGGGVEAAWVSEVRERLGGYRRGEVRAVAAEEVLDEAGAMGRSSASGSSAAGSEHREAGMHSRLEDLERLTIAERIQLVEDLWDSISGAEEMLHLTDAQRAELDRRLAAHANRPDAAISWADLRAELLARD
ncbi:MAG: addiction module protein [Actinobacteria bacterium]|nr:addiction module protein [Actinomycetota bacterium]